MLAQIDVIVLAGGLGTRLQPALSPGLPKVLAPVHGRPFIGHLLDNLYGRGIRRVVLALGYGARAVIEFLSSQQWPADFLLHTAIEDRPLGTGGALRYALPMSESQPVIALNGDTYADTHYGELLAFHRSHQAKVTMLLATVDDTSRYGKVEVNQDGLVTRFVEKATSVGPGRINAGAYAVDRDVIGSLPTGRPLSWENDVLARWSGPGLYGIANCGRFIDIGIPVSLDDAGRFFTGDKRGHIS